MIAFYKETKFKEISELGIKVPEDWEVVKLREIAEIIMGQSPPSSTYNEYGEGLPFLQGKAEFGYIYPNPVKYTTKPIKVAEKDDILISVRAPVGDVNIAPYKLCIGRGLAAIRINKSRGHYLFYFYWFQTIKSWLESLGKGSTFQAITKKDLENLEISLPSLEEQKAIAEILSTIDKAIEKTQEAIEKTEKLKKGLMQKLLTGEIRIKEENGKCVFYKETEFQDTEIGKIPKDWEVVKLKDISKVVSGFAFPLKYQGKRRGEYPFIKVNDLNFYSKYVYGAENYIDMEDLKQLRAKIYPRDTIIFPKIGMAVFHNKYRILKVEGTFDNNIAGIIADKRKVSIEYLYYFFSCNIDLGKLASSTTMPSIKKSTLENIKVPLPPLEEQKRVAEVLMTVDKKMELLRKKKELLEKVKKWFMQKLLTGEIRVRTKLF